MVNTEIFHHIRYFLHIFYLYLNILNCWIFPECPTCPPAWVTTPRMMWSTVWGTASLASWSSSSGRAASPPWRDSLSSNWWGTVQGPRLEVSHLSHLSVDVSTTDNYHLLANENLAARLAVMGGLASLGLLVGRGKGRLLWATAGAGAGAWLSHPHTLQALYSGQSPALPASIWLSFPAGELPAVAESVDSARISEFVLKSGENFDSIISSIRRQTQQNLAEDKPKITKESSLVFVKSSELQTDSDGFKGDQGMSREEDKDLYATRTWTGRVIATWDIELIFRHLLYFHDNINVKKKTWIYCFLSGFWWLGNAKKCISLLCSCSF